MRHWAAICAAIALGLVVAGAQKPQLPDPSLRVGDEAPLFGPVRVHNAEAAGIDSYTLGRHVGRSPESPRKAVVLTFLASWCEPCKRDLPLLVELDRKYRDQGLQVVGVSIDRDAESFAELRTMMERFQVKFPVLMDRHQLLARRYLGEATAMPSIFVIRADGTFALVRRGYEEDATQFLPEVVAGLLATPEEGKSTED